MNFWTLDNLCTSTGAGRWANPPTSARRATVIDGLSTDTRALRPGQAFLALRGATHDGHDHAAHAARAGAGVLIVDRPVTLPEGLDTPVILVPDTRRALAVLGATRRASLRARVIAVCGSNGKTGTVRLLSAALGPHGAGLAGTASIKSFNNDIGVPLTILGARDTDDYLICEVGSNAPGEINALGAIVKPDIALVTSIGREHLAGFGDIEGVAREEASIFRHVRPGGLAIATADAPDLQCLGQCVHRRLTFGLSPQADLRLTGARYEHGPAGLMLHATTNGPAFTLPLIGRHNALNALGAILVARELGVTDARACAGLAHAQGADMRLAVQTVHLAGPGGPHAPAVTLINDAYNANPESVLAGLETLAEVSRAMSPPALRRVAILGDLLELGQAEAESHAEVLRAALTHAELVVAAGARMQRACQGLPIPAGRTLVPMHALDGPVPADIASLIEPGDCVLVKGSRSSRTERVADAILARSAPVPPPHGTPA